MKSLRPTNPECLGITQRLNKKSYNLSELEKYSEVRIRISLGGLVKHVIFVDYKLNPFRVELLTVLTQK